MENIVKVVTLWQPWASLVAYGLKQYETRSWPTSYRGKILIHAGKKFDRTMIHQVINDSAVEPHVPEGMKINTGVVVAIADLVDCTQINVASFNFNLGYPKAISELEMSVGNWQYGRYAWKLENVQRLEHEIEWKGGQGLRNAPFELVEQVEKQLALSKI